MYTSYFGLTEIPFSITPDPRFLYLSPRHREALGHLVYGIKETGGFVCLTGEVGTGKTTVTRALLSQLPDYVDIAMILNPRMTVAEFLAAICDELRVEYPAKNRSVKVFVDALNEYLLHAHAQGRRVVVIVDEAQNLIPAVLEQVRLLTNLETAKTKLLQIVLVGQPELNDLLSRQELRQLSQRVTARYHLQPLSLSEVGEYVAHRVHVGGCERALFGSGAIRAIWMMSGGIPRIINVICDRALLGAYARNSEVVTAQIIKRAGQEVKGELADLPGAPESTKKQRRINRGQLATSLVTAAVIMCFITLYSIWFSPKESSNTEPLVATLESNDSSITQFPLLSLDKWIEQQSVDVQTSMVSSLSAILKLWGVEYLTSTQKPCAFAATFQLKCETRNGQVNDLKMFNRPALLYLRNPATGESTTAVIERIDNQFALLNISSQRKFRVALTDLSHYWTGDYLFIWRVPPGFSEPLSVGDSSRVVPWLRDKLLVTEGLAFSQADSNVFDQELGNNVRRFQIKHGLVADGIVGPQTLMILNEKSYANSTPQLRVN